MSAVRGLGYTIVEATDLDRWASFGTDLLGLQLAARTDDHLLFRADEKSWRIRVNRSERDRMTTVGWEVEGSSQLESIVEELEAEGYTVTRATREQAYEREVVEYVSFDDPDGTLMIELFYGQQRTSKPFVSPTGARFVIGENGLGHVNQSVKRPKEFARLYLGILGFKVSDHIQYTVDKETVFMHCNPRHHSYGFGYRPEADAAVGHLMLEVDDIRTVGQAWDRVTEEKAAPLISALGQHTNDEMISFYVRSPSGFGVEYGYGGIAVDDATWVARRYTEAHYWGHQMAAAPKPSDAALIDEIEE